MGYGRNKKERREKHTNSLCVYPLVPPDARRPVPAARRDESPDVGDGDGDDWESLR